MLVFPIARTTDDCACFCRWEKMHDGAYGLRFFQNGKPKTEPVVVSKPERDEYALLDSFISGGTFEGFLTDAMARFDGRVCLFLRPQSVLFPLPCPNGVGKRLPYEKNLSGFQYAESLCAYWQIQNSKQTRLLLTDGDRSLREKYRIAERSGVPYLIASRQTLHKLKGAL